MPSSAATVLSPSRLALRLRPPSPSPSLLPRPPRPVATVHRHRHNRPRRIARIRVLPPSCLVAAPSSTSREKTRGTLRVRFCRMTGQKKTAVDSCRGSSSRSNRVGPDWKEFTCLPLKHMVASQAFAATHPDKRAWIHRVGLEGFVSLPWGQEIRKDVVENFINTAHSTKL